MEVGEKRGRDGGWGEKGERWRLGRKGGEMEVGEKRGRGEVEVGEKRERGLKDWKERGERGWRSRDLVLYLGGLLSWPLM